MSSVPFYIVIEII